VIFYVGVPDVEAALQQAGSLGGTRKMGPDQAPKADQLPTWDDRWMNVRPRSYMRYGVGCAAVWAVIFAVVAARDREKFRTILPVFGGWWMGWTSATIARYVYPPPKSRPSWAGDRRS
jgi:hypothetical protein